MLASILAGLIFAITIPMSTVNMAIKTQQKLTGQPSKLDKLKQRLKLGKNNKKKDEKQESKTQKALKNLQRVLTVLIVFLRILASIVGVIGTVITFLLGTGLILLLAGVVGAVILSEELGDLNFSRGKRDRTGGVGSSEATVGGGTVVERILYFGQHWVDEKVEYSMGTWRIVPFMGKGAGPDGEDLDVYIRTDCSGFATGIIQWIEEDYYFWPGGRGSPNSNSHMFTDGNDELGAYLANKPNWQKLNAAGMELSDLEPGDIMAAHGHVECYISPTETMGWGYAHTQCPVKCQWVKNANGTFSENAGAKSSHQYKTIWRYTGSGGGSMPDDSDDSDDEAEEED